MAETESNLPEIVEKMGDLTQVYNDAPKKLRESPHFSFYVDALRTGWSARKLQSYAQRYFRENISHDSFNRLRKLIPEKDIHVDKLKEEFLNGVDTVIDVFQEMPDAISIQKRVVLHALQYMKMAVQTHALPHFLETVGKELDRYYRMVKDYASFQHHLGMLPSGIQGAEVTTTGVRLNPERMFADEILEMEPEERETVKEGLRLIVAFKKRKEADADNRSDGEIDGREDTVLPGQ